jgi:hypothetical protein
MVIASETVATWNEGDAYDSSAPSQLVDALQEFGKSRATRLLIRRAQKKATFIALCASHFQASAESGPMNWLALYERSCAQP